MHVLQGMNCFSAKPISINPPPSCYQSIVGSHGCHGLSFKAKAKLSAEANVIEKESNNANEKIGDIFFLAYITPFPFTRLIKPF